MDSSLKLPPLDVPRLLKAHGLTPKKGLGQNFLIDAAALLRVVQAADLPPDADVLEIGPGLGSLTRYLALGAQRVVAVELDKNLIPVLHEVLAGVNHVDVVQGDMLELDPAALGLKDGYLVVANIPYYITSAIIRHLLQATVKPERLVLTMQREVAERICARPGDMSLLALSVQLYGQPKIVTRIPAGSFYPAPNVDSSVLRVDLHPQPLIPGGQVDAFFKLIHAGFAQKRKTLRNTLSAGLHWPPEQAAAFLLECNIDPQRRAETLSLAEWAVLTAKYSGLNG